MILAMDLSLSFPAFAILQQEGNRVRIVDIRYVDNKRFSSLSHGERLNRISKSIIKIAEDYPTLSVVVREKGFTRHITTTQALFKVVGVSDLEIFRHYGITHIHEISPTSVKKYITGDGKASKLDVDRGVRKFLVDEQKLYTFLTDDLSDAVGVGIAYLLSTNNIESVV